MRKRHSRDSRAPGNNEMHGVTPVLPNGAMGQRTAARRSLCIDSFPAAGGPSDDGYNGCCARTKELGGSGQAVMDPSGPPSHGQQWWSQTFSMETV